MTSVFLDLAIALGLGLLVGLQRQRTHADLAGIRTFPLVTVLGAVTALLAQPLGGAGLWLVGAGLLGVAAMAVIGNVVKLRARSADAADAADAADPGLTTEMALLLMYTLGAYLVLGERAVAIVLGGGVAVLLQLKEKMHRLAERIGEEDFKAIIQFVLISLVILPVLPNQTLGPYGVLNPQQIWWMVVLIVGIGLGGYVAYKLFGERAGTLVAGLLGGLISSTATTVSYARSTAGARGEWRMSAVHRATVVILMASAVVYLRVLLEMAVAARSAFPAMAPPVVAMLVATALVAGFAWVHHRPEGSEMPGQGNPSELRPAILFGLLYALVLLAVAAAKEHLGTSGLYAVAVLSGLTDMDAITLSTARLVDAGRLEALVAWRLILVASLANLGFKAGLVAILGPRQLGLRIGVLFGILGIVGAALLTFWPH
jgi:uncharacterized membrane protein (DUF4010 family)